MNVNRMTTGRSLHIPFLLITIVAAALLLAPATRAQPAERRAGVVVQFGAGNVQRFCVDLGDDGSASGYEVLQATGLALILEGSALGATVCQLDGVGCAYPSEGCFCQYPTYWSYSRLVDGAWQYSSLGLTSTTVRGGDVEGWAWGEGNANVGAAPPLIPFDQLCPPVAPTAPPATSTPPPASATAVPPRATSVPATAPSLPTSTLPPTATVGGSATPRPTATASATLGASPTPTRAASPTLSPTLMPSASPVAPTPQSSATPPPAADLTASTSPASYYAFALLATVLAAALVIVQRRKAG
ncbi:MAG: hypothetical protein H6638_06490 [Ardenticatenales bacterium]|nr:hypothetical protein [Ardenticatenales bacterium]